MTIRNNGGSRIEPRGTHALMQKDLEECPFKTTFILQFDKKDKIGSEIYPEIPYITFQLVKTSNMPNPIRSL